LVNFIFVSLYLFGFRQEPNSGSGTARAGAAGSIPGVNLEMRLDVKLRSDARSSLPEISQPISKCGSSVPLAYEC